jgi:purine-binding chemotaxis protein CheW
MDEFLTLRLGAEEYGIDIQRVQEIRSYEVPTRIAKAPEFIRGVVNLRGVIVPIIDLRLKLGCTQPDGSVRYDEFTVVVVLNIAGRIVGAVVDAVSDVLAVKAEDVRPAPSMNASVDTSFITGLVSLEQRTIILLDIDSLMSSPEMGLVGVSGAPNGVSGTAPSGAVTPA